MSRVSVFNKRIWDTVMRKIVPQIFARIANYGRNAQRAGLRAQRAALGYLRVIARIARESDDVITGLAELDERLGLRRLATAAARGRRHQRDREQLELVALRAALRNRESARCARARCAS